VLLKIFLLAGFVGVGLLLGSRAWPTWMPPGAHAGSGFPVDAFVGSLFFIAFAFSGWNAVVYAAEEFEAPERTVPRAMIVGCLLVAALYLVVNWIFVANLTPADATVVFRYESSRVTLGHAVVERLLGPGLGAMMSLFTVAVFLSAMSAMIMVGPRVYAAMARDGFLPAILAGKDGKPPVASILLQGALSILIVFTHPLRAILQNLGAILTLFAALTAAGLFKVALSRAAGLRPRPAALVAAVVYVLSAAAMLATAYRRNGELLLWSAAVVLLGLGGYAVARARQRAAEARAVVPNA
jgi:APA family basic amino acid/polyamine antiporter